MTASEAGDAPNQDTFGITHVLDAPRERVWEAFTDPERMKEWWGPKGFSVIASAMDLRPGGTYHYGMSSPNGAAMWGKFVYREVVAPERIVLVSSFSDEAGGIARHPMSPTWPLETLSTFRFADEGGRTALTVTWTPLEADEAERETFAGAQDGMRAGWTGTLDRLAAYLAQEPDKAGKE